MSPCPFPYPYPPLRGWTTGYQARRGMRVGASFTPYTPAREEMDDSDDDVVFVGEQKGSKRSRDDMEKGDYEIARRLQEEEDKRTEVISRVAMGNMDYEALSALDDTVDRKPVAAPRVSYLTESGGRGCPVCLERILDDQLGASLDCNDHVFHAACIDRWVSVGGASCPVCRKPL